MNVISAATPRFPRPLTDAVCANHVAAVELGA